MNAPDLARAEVVIGILMDWAHWMKGFEGNQGYPSKSAGFTSGYVSATFEDMCETADALRNQVVDSCIDDLAPNLKAAIYHKYLAAVYRMRDLEGSMMAAHVEMAIKLKAKGVLW